MVLICSKTEDLYCSKMTNCNRKSYINKEYVYLLNLQKHKITDIDFVEKV